PPQRTACILKDCSVAAIIVDRRFIEGLRVELGGRALPVVEELEELQAFGADLLLVKGPEKGGEHEESPVATDNLAYILYTSGSTGKPKGVVHTCRSALSFIDWCSDTFEPTRQDRFSSHAPFHFDLSILDIYVPLKHGATLVLIGENVGKQPLRLAPLIGERRISVWYSTPSILRLLVECGQMTRYEYSALRFVLFAGEVFPVKHLRALKALWPHPRYFNLYGPTETNVCTSYEIPPEIPEDRTEPFPIGKACSGDATKVMDEHGREVPCGEEGEFYVSGGSVMVGYWNLPERNAQVFFVDDAGTVWYRTGDIVREGRDGNYVFIGRRDRMVKRRGYRVELGEIESALYRHPSVTEAAVIALPDQEGGVQITAFLSWAEEKPPSIIALKQFCVKNLPMYMIPDRFSIQPTLPKTSTDKIDYQRLRELD
ncbi:MAG: AMP-binding protein, partial [Candidatus Latescibacteria bacterium]|nr:AMP-binding protein [Candidatus Latescibacterota bacterium]